MSVYDVVRRAKLQQQLNLFGGSAGFEALVTDGQIGPATLNAWVKTMTWLDTKYPKPSAFAALAAWSQSTLMNNLSDAIATLTNSAAEQKPRPAPVPGASPKTGKSTWPYYVAAGLGVVTILASAYVLSAKRTKRVSSGMAGSSRRH